MAESKISVLRNMSIAIDTAIKEGKPIPIFNNIMPVIHSEEVLILAYSNIQGNKGALTKGTNDITVDGSSMKTITSIQTRLKNKTFHFPRVRRIYVPKPKKIKWTIENLISSGRPLGMPDFESKVVQEAMRLVLEAIYEPLFDQINTNHGFRRAKGCHDAFNKIL